ncbi:MAG: hypothetical protein HY820_41150 [Acidobacteria bacterium]|nr:hypothetical protein [Acidobacteriota bacterium]
MVDLLPCLFIHLAPIRSYFAVEVAIAHCRGLKALSQRILALGGHEVMHGAVNEPAALARPYQPVYGANRIHRKDNVDAFGHGGVGLMISAHIIYTGGVYVK